MTLIDPNAEAYYIGLMNAAGYRDKDLKKPIIGIVEPDQPTVFPNGKADDGKLHPVTGHMRTIMLVLPAVNPAALAGRSCRIMRTSSFPVRITQPHKACEF